MGNFEDLSGRRFGNWLVQSFAFRKHGHLIWLCLCDCGKLKNISGPSLRSGGTHSCISCSLRGRNKTHGLCGTKEYKMWAAAKCRAKKKGLPFNIEISDIIIPEKCPLLGVKIVRPSLDRIKPHLGYVKGNIWVVSRRANVMKNDSSLNEMIILVENWKKAATKWKT